MSVESFRPAVRERPELTFVVLAYAISWGIWSGGYLALPEAIPFVTVVFAGAFGPAGAAAVTVWASGRLIRPWLRELFRWRTAPRWYLAAILVPVLIYGIATAMIVLFGASVHSARIGRGLALFFGWLPIATFVSGGNEEIGWRGFLLPLVQQRYDALSASLLVGGVWAGWHLPIYVLPLGLTNGPFALFVPFIVFASIVLTWLYNSTDGSVIPAMLLHGSLNSAVGVFAGVVNLDTVSDSVVWGSRIIGVGLVATALVIMHGYTTISDDNTRQTDDRSFDGRH